MADPTRSHERGNPTPSRLRLWLWHHATCAASSIVRLLRKPGAALLTISAMALAISLPLGLWLTLANIEYLSGSVEDSRNIDLFLTPGITGERAAALAQQLRGWNGIAAIEHQPPEQGLEELRRRDRWHEITDLLSGENPLPHRLRVIPSNDVGALIPPLKALPDVDVLQHDAQWRQRLEDWLNVGHRLVLVLGVLFGLGALLVVAGSVRLDIQTCHEDMQILHLLGASNGFIRRPFLYLGVWYGVIAGALAIGVWAGAKISLHAPLSALASSYHSNFVMRGFTPVEAIFILTGSTALGGLGAWLVSGYSLRRFQSK